VASAFRNVAEGLGRCETIVPKAIDHLRRDAIECNHAKEVKELLDLSIVRGV